MTSKTFCALPHTSFTISVKGVRPCCRWDKWRSKKLDNGKMGFDIPLNEFSQDPQGHLENGYFKTLREEQLKGEVGGCHKCYFDESYKDKPTMRMHYNEKYKNIVDEKSSSDNFKQLKYIEIALDNICNLECRMCDSDSSSKLFKRDKFLGIIPATRYEKDTTILADERDKFLSDITAGITPSAKYETDISFLNKLDLSQLDTVKILGGEPFVSPNLEPLIDLLFKYVNPKNLTIEFATNGSVFPSKSLIEKFSKLKELILWVSLDATHKINDYQRMRGNYIETINNMIQLENTLPNVFLGFSSTISIYNANYMPKTKRDIENLGYTYTYGWVYNSSSSLEFAPLWFRDWLKERVKGTEFELVYENFFLDKKYDHFEWHKFIHETKILDQFYNVELADYNPELALVLRKRAFEQDAGPKKETCRYCNEM